MLIMIGSVAACRNGVKLRRFEPKDVDFLSTEENYNIKRLKDAHIDKKVEVFYHPYLADYSWSGEVASRDELYTIKMSHSYWTLKHSWKKHVRDLAMLKRAGASMIPELHSLLYKIWEERYGKKSANLEQPPEDFFHGGVRRIYEHDSIHAAVSYFNGTPLFNRILRDGHEVAVDRSKFEALPHDLKLKLVREEVYATALERKLIPSGFTEDSEEAYEYALKKTITSFTKGWFPTFILDNYEELRAPSEDYAETFRQNRHLLKPLHSSPSMI